MTKQEEKEKNADKATLKKNRELIIGLTKMVQERNEKILELETTVKNLVKPVVNCWVAISEQLPEMEQDVLLFDDWKTMEGEPRKDIRVGYLSEYTTRKTSDGVVNSCEWKGTEFAFNITHWMRLPEPPCS